ncbi:MAG: spermidine/putrescine ABC transporter substrate-binding protein [Lentisphaerae bacterium]|nr:spermidine/putrescine ABC transporter substrate-binding protein [Lentisphaerota bacterium]
MKMKMTSLISAAACAIVALAATAKETETPVLRIYTWADYVSPEVVEGFEKSANCRVEIDTFDSNETMFEQIKAGKKDCDIIMPSSYLVELMAEEGLVVELDHSKIPNVRKNFDKRFAKLILDPSFRYNAPYAVTYTGLMYDKGKVPTGTDVTSWSILDNPAFKDRITLLDDQREVIGAALIALGYSINTKKPEEISAAAECARRWRRNILKFDVEGYKASIASGETWIAHAYSTDAMQVIHGNRRQGVAPRPDLAFVLPKEGFVIAFDEMVISAHSQNPDLAHAFIDYLYRGDVAKANMEFIIGLMPVKPGIDSLGKELSDMIMLDAETVKRGEVLGSFEDDPKTFDLYNNAWTKIKLPLEAK